MHVKYINENTCYVRMARFIRSFENTLLSLTNKHKQPWASGLWEIHSAAVPSQAIDQASSPLLGVDSTRIYRLES